MAMATFLYVLTLLEPGEKFSPKVGTQIVSSKAYFSQQSCEEEARLIAQSMFVQSGDKYGYRCVPVEYEPPKLTQSEETAVAVPKTPN